MGDIDPAVGNDDGDHTQNLERYTIEREVGRGSMGVVFKATDQVTGDTVALKELIPAGLAGNSSPADRLERFHRESQALEGLNHQNIVRVTGSFAEGERHFMVMEYLDGVLLSDMLANGPLAPDVAIGVINQVLAALDAAHAQGIVHRDLKPDNIFVLADGTVKVADFGVAHIEDSSGLTQAGEVLGTIGYMSPEQVKGEPPSPRSDIFASGILLHEMLAGTNPFSSEQPTTTMYRISFEEPAIPEAIRASLPEHVAPVLSKALAKNPMLRYESAKEMLADLAEGNAPDTTAIDAETAARASQAQSGSTVPPASQPPRAKLDLSKFKWPLVAVLIIVLVGVGAFISNKAAGERRAAEAAQQQAVLAEGQTMARSVSALKGLLNTYNDTTADMLVKAKRNADDLNAWSASWQLAQGEYDARVAAVDAHNSAETEAESASYISGSYVYSWGRYTYIPGRSTYVGDYWDYPDQPKRPAKIKVDLSPQNKQLDSLRADVVALQSQLTSEAAASAYFAPVYVVMDELAVALVKEIDGARVVLGASLSTDSERGLVMNASDILTMQSRTVLSDAVAKLDESIAAWTASNGVTVEELVAGSTAEGEPTAPPQ